MPRFLLCTDLDRTLLPNGEAVESAEARPGVRRFASHSGVSLAYVSGRDRGLVQEAIGQYGLPQPDWVISDVGSSLHRIEAGLWSRSDAWEDRVGQPWGGRTAADLAPLLAGLDGIEQQEPAKQGRHKLSYYHRLGVDAQELEARVRGTLEAAGIGAHLSLSLDEAAGVGLLDILPSSAGKLQAVRFLMEQQGFDLSNTLFAGDSGNDLEILVSPVASVIVANASSELIATAQRLAASQGQAERIHVARGGFLGMNGHYGAGILEGIGHFYPDLVPWMLP